MKYQANPVIVDAFKIYSVDGVNDNQSLRLTVGDGITPKREVVTTPGMTARMNPHVGDYWVIQEDGYIYLNPKEVFERKYSPVQQVATA